MRTRFHFQASCLLVAEPCKVFAFHENPANIRRIAPASLKILSVDAEPTAHEGGRFEMVVQQFGIRVKWNGRWEVVDKPHLLVDVGERCPFPGWRHRHEFKESTGGTLMTDAVEFELPAGRLLAPFARILLDRMFQSRHVATAAHFAR